MTRPTILLNSQLHADLKKAGADDLEPRIPSSSSIHPRSSKNPHVFLARVEDRDGNVQLALGFSGDKMIVPPTIIYDENGNRAGILRLGQPGASGHRDFKTTGQKGDQITVAFLMVAASHPLGSGVIIHSVTQMFDVRDKHYQSFAVRAIHPELSTSTPEGANNATTALHNHLARTLD